MRHLTIRCGFAAIVILFVCSDAFGQSDGYLGRVQQALQESPQESAAPRSGGRETSQSANALDIAFPIQTVASRLLSHTADRHALIVAIREYPNAQQLRSLPGTEHDAVHLASTLQNGGFAGNNVVVVYDDSPEPEFRPTRANINRELNKLVERAAEASLVAVFLTCHGISLEDESYICPADATDVALTDPKKAAQELISIKDIAARLSERCKASGRLLVIDTCRDRTCNRTTGYVKNLEALERSTVGLWLMSSCSEGQYSCISDRIREGERHALFSRFIAEGLEGEADLLGDNDGDVSLFELYTYAFVKTRDASREIGHVQTPELFGLASPFTLTTTGNFVSRQTLTTSDPGMEASRSANLLASDAVLKLRAADLEYRRTVSAANVSEATIEEASRILNRYMCHLLGNQLHAALELDEHCRLAWVARGLCYRTCGLYDRAFEAFQRGDEHFSLFVKAQTGMLNRYAAYDHRHGQVWRDENGNLVPRIQKTQEGAMGYVGLFEHPGDEKPKYSVQRQQKVRISKIQAPWLYVDAIDDQEIIDGGWIHRDEVHWYPEAVEVYTPTSPMRSWGSGGAADRLDYTSDGLYALSEQLAQPAMAIEQLAIPFQRAGGAIRQASSVIGFLNSLPFAPAIANSPGTTAGYIAMNDSYARIPSNYVARGDNFARIPGDYARVAQQWSGLANTYYLGQQREEQVKKARERLRDMGEPNLLEEHPVMIVIPSPEERR